MKKVSERTLQKAIILHNDSAQYQPQQNITDIIHRYTGNYITTKRQRAYIFTGAS